MITSKQMAEKFHMFINLLNHLEDYIRNKKERKDQLNVPKNVRIVLREVISSKITLHYFINKEEFSTKNYISSKSNEQIRNEIKYIKKVNPMSFNQKYLENTNFFYDSSNEIYILNYLSVEKLFSITKFCFKRMLQRKFKEYQKLYEGENSKNFVLSNIYEKQIKNVNPKNRYINTLSIKKENSSSQTLDTLFENDKSIKKIRFPVCNLKKQISYLSYEELESNKRKKSFKKNSSLPLIYSDNKNKKLPQCVSYSMLSSSESSNNVLLNYKKLDIYRQKINSENEKRKMYFINKPNIFIVKNYKDEQTDNVKNKKYKNNNISVPIIIKEGSNLRYFPNISNGRK